MSYFVALAVQASPEDVAECFGESFCLVDASCSPIGKVVRGGNESTTVVLVNSRGCATDIVQDIDAKAGKFVTSLANLLSYDHVHSVSIVLHWSQGQILQERVEAKGKRKVGLQAFLEEFPSLKEDTRYAILP